MGDTWRGDDKEELLVTFSRIHLTVSNWSYIKTNGPPENPLPLSFIVSLNEAPCEPRVPPNSKSAESFP